MSSGSENLLTTYFALGQSLPGARVVETEGYVALLSDLPHASGNFAVRLRLDPWSAGELRALAASRPAFQVVALPEDGPAHLPELLRRAGFGLVQRLVAMEAKPSFGLAGLEMRRCEAGERSTIGRFTTDAFFAREPILLRHTMAEALAASPLPVYVHQVRERPLAAVTLSRTEGALGLYNLCVGGMQRGRGLGREVVAWCLAQAAAEGRMAHLQCSPALEPWYARLGFESVGAITAWSL